VSLQLKVGDTVGDAVRVSGLCARHALDEATLRVGVWGRLQPVDMALREHDRVELYRGLQVDPKEARRLRYKRGRRTAAP
jgi:putative ubiquitin-RnfH superfamily antitoxin RatB of RatAB toxin-antitoxin module